MPNFVAVELNENVMVVACAKGSGKNFQINHLFEVPVESSSTDEQRGSALKESLAERGVTKAELIGVVNRKQVEMREVEVPPAPDNELPDLVRFQARNVFASMNDNWKLDYVPFDNLPVDASEPKQLRVLAIAISPNLNDTYTAVAEHAGLKLKRIVFGPYSCCGLYESLMSDDSNRLLIVPAAGHFDFTVAAGPNLIAARSVKAPTDAEHSARQIVSEVRRTLASTKALLQDQPVGQVLIGASEKQFGAIGAEVESTLDLPVAYLDVFATMPARQLSAARPEHPEHFAAVVGSLSREYSSKRQPVDFVNPRKPIVRQLNYRPALFAAVAAAIFCLMIGTYAWMTLSNQSKQIADKQTELDNLKKENQGEGNQPSIDKMVGEVELMDQWEFSRTNWLDELKTLSELMKTPDDILVTNFQGQPSKESTVKMYLKVRTTEKTNQESDWIQLLFDDYGVETGASKPDNVKSDYPFTSDLTLTIKPDSEAILTRIKEEAEVRLDSATNVAEDVPANSAEDQAPKSTTEPTT